MKVVGIVGGIGAGKSTVVALIEQLQPIESISADLIGHEILLKGHGAYAPIVETFGTTILDEQGEIIRKKLGELVFGNKERLKCLNSITHPLIVEEIKKRIAYIQKNEPHKLIILEAALLIESGLIHLTDKVIAIYAGEEVRLERVKRREGLHEEQILNRIKAQKKWEEFKSVADEVIDNSISLEVTKAQVEALLKRL